jgi:hypothetical protein
MCNKKKFGLWIFYKKTFEIESGNHRFTCPGSSNYEIFIFSPCSALLNLIQDLLLERKRA